MNPSPLCVIQARYNSVRLPGKMVMKLGEETLIARAWRTACEAFGAGNCVVAISRGEPVAFRNHLNDIGARVYQSPAEENDVLLRFFHCAHTYRWHPDSIVYRFTPDDWRRDVTAMRRVVAGERLPVEIGGEAFTLSQLDEAERTTVYPWLREHITYAVFKVHPPKPPVDGLPWSIDTMDDLLAARAKLAEMEG